jgi:1-acyl-sn-glycerol-3-phosphate acyltransferase
VAIRAIIYFVFFIIFLTTAIIVGFFSREYAISVFILWVELVKKMYQIHVDVENDNDDSEDMHGCVYILLNQTSLIDGPITAYALPRPWRGIANIEYVLIPFFGWAIGAMHYVIIRQWPWQSKRTLKKVEDFIKRKGNIFISIEGRRSKDGSLSSFKKGPVVLAINAQAKIIPVILSGTSDILGYGQIKINSGKVKVRFLQAIDTQGLTYDDRNKLVDSLFSLAQKEIQK